MKKLFAALCGLLSVTAVQACNWNAENCTFEMLNNIQRQIANLKQNPKFMQEKFAELQAKAQYIDRKTASCSNWCILSSRLPVLTIVTDHYYQIRCPTRSS